jgi:hypothetical protein
MSNHFHILLEVPDRPQEPLSDAELVSRLKRLSGMSGAGTIEQQLGWFRERGQDKAAEELKQRGPPIRKGFAREAVLAVVEAKGRLPLDEYLRLRVRYFADGAMLGTRNFVDEVFTSLRDRFGPKA